MKRKMPLSESVFLILIRISKGPIHGYGIINDVKSMTDGRVELSTGTLYGAISRMIGDGWIEKHHTKTESGRERKEYRITKKGKRILNSEMERIKSLIKIANFSWIKRQA